MIEAAADERARVAAEAKGAGVGGADRDRTDDLLNAIQALSQLSYGPNEKVGNCGVREANIPRKCRQEPPRRGGYFDACQMRERFLPLTASTGGDV